MDVRKRGVLITLVLVVFMLVSSSRVIGEVDPATTAPSCSPTACTEGFCPLDTYQSALVVGNCGGSTEGTDCKDTSQNL